MDERDEPTRPPHSPPEEERDEGSFASRVIPDMFRRALMTGIGSVFMTEESIRSALGDLKMPKEAMNYVVTQADRTKRELIATLARELRNFLDNLELDELLANSLQDTTFEINTTIRVRRTDEGKNKLEVTDRETRVVKADRGDEEGAPKKRKRSSRKKSKTSTDDAAG